MLSVKATHNIETRRLVFEDARTLTYDQLCNELRRIFPIRGPFCLSSVSFTSKGDFKWIPDIHGESKFEEFIRPHLNSELTDADLLRFTIIELSVSLPNRNRVHTAPVVHRATSSAWRYVPNPPTRRNTTSSQKIHRQVPAAQTRPPMSTAGIEASLDQLEKDFREGEESFTKAFDALKREVIRLLAQANPSDSTTASTSASPSANQNTQCGVTVRAEDIDNTSSLRIPGAFDSSPNTARPLVANGHNGQRSVNIWCDYCGRGVRGLRAKCNECLDYDVCMECIQHHDASKKHATRQGHTFTMVQENQPNGVSSVAALTPPAAPASISRMPQPDSVIHYGIVCDCCQETIVGPRNKCMVCFDYDLCEKCYPQVKNIHTPNHSFYVIERSEFPSSFLTCTALERGEHGSGVHSNQGRPLPLPPPRPQNASTRVIHQATCDLCDSVIMGTRHKCLDCPDYDVCSTCYLIVGEQHPHHLFVAMTTPQNLTRKGSSRNKMHFANCDACKRPIFNVRYKCMHPECPDYDLCEKCEALPISIHPDNHPMLKMRNPFTVIPTVYRVGGRTLIPEEPPTSTPCCDLSASEETPVQSTVEVGDSRVLSDSKLVVDHAVAVNSPEPVLAKEILPIEDVPTPQELPKETEDAFALSPELVTPVSRTPSITGRLSLKQMLSEPAQSMSDSLSQAFQEKAASAAEMLFRPLPTDGPVFGLNFKQEYRAAFVSNNNVADGQVFPAGAEFVKSWRMCNDGDVAWPDTTEVVFVAGDRLAATEHEPSKFHVGRVEPGQEVDVPAGEMKAPELPGKYVGYWKLGDGTGRTFGQSMWCEIVVAEPESNLSKSLSSSEMIMPGSAPSAASVTTSAPQAAHVEEPRSPTTPSISSGIPSSDIDTDDSSALLEDFDTASDEAEWEEVINQTNRGAIDPEYIVLYDENHTDEE